MTPAPHWQGRGRLLLHGGQVITPSGPSTAILIEDGVIAWIGDDPRGVDADRRVPLDGALVHPGFVDAHVHGTSTGLTLIGLDLTDCRSLTQALERIEAAARSDPGALIGHGWDETRWPEGRPPTRAEVDRATGGALAYLSRIDVHSAVVSTALLDGIPGIADLDGFTADGPLSRAAHHAAREAAQTRIGSALRGRAQRAMRARAAAVGIVAVQEMAGPVISSPADLRELLALAEEEPGPIVHAYWGELAERGGIERARELGAVGVAGDLFIDGSIGSRTACLREPYRDEPTSRGAQYLAPEQVESHIRAATEAGLQAGFHVIGDRASDVVVGAFARVAEDLGRERLRPLRHRIEHAEMLDDEHLRVLADLGVTLSMQPVFDGLWGGADGMYDRRLGADRMRGMNRFASALEAGALLAFGSDAPVTPLGPRAAMRDAMEHHTPAERVSQAAAFQAHTRAGWQAIGCDDAGEITVGAPAHLAIWAPDADARSEALCTIVHGRTVHDHGLLG